MKITPGQVHPLSRGVLSQLPVSALAEQAEDCDIGDSQGLKLLQRLEGSSARNALDFYQQTQSDLAVTEREQVRLGGEIRLTRNILNTGAVVGGAGLGLATMCGAGLVGSTTQSGVLTALASVGFIGGVFATVLLPLFAPDLVPEALPSQDRRRRELDCQSTELNHALNQVGPLASQVLEQGIQAEIWQDSLQTAIQDYQVEVLGPQSSAQQPQLTIKARDLKALSKAELVQTSDRLGSSQHWGLPFDQPLNTAWTSLRQLPGNTAYDMFQSASPEQQEALIQSAKLAQLPTALPSSGTAVDIKQLAGQANEFARQVWSQLSAGEEGPQS